MCTIRGSDPTYLKFILSLSIQFGSLSFDEFQNLIITHERILENQAQFYDHNSLLEANLANMQAMSLNGPTSSNYTWPLTRPSWNLHDFMLLNSQKNASPNSSSFKGKKVPHAQCHICKKFRKLISTSSCVIY